MDCFVHIFLQQIIYWGYFYKIEKNFKAAYLTMKYGYKFSLSLVANTHVNLIKFFNQYFFQNPGLLNLMTKCYMNYANFLLEFNRF